MTAQTEMDAVTERERERDGRRAGVSDGCGIYWCHTVMYIDLRKILGKIRGWDDVVWEPAGGNLIAVHNNRLANERTHKALREALLGVPAMTATRTGRAVVMKTVARIEAIREIAAGHLVIANIAIDEMLAAQNDATLTHLAADASTFREVRARAEAVLASRKSAGGVSTEIHDAPWGGN